MAKFWVLYKLEKNSQSFVADVFGLFDVSKI